MIVDYNEVRDILAKAGEMFAILGVVKPGANVDILRKGMPVFRQRSVTGVRGGRMVAQEINTLGPAGGRQTRLVVKHTPPCTRP